MKNIFFILLFIASAFTAQAQLSGSVQTINADDVPAAVISSQATYFPGINVSVWEKQSVNSPKKNQDRYIANFRNNGQKARAKYHQNGTGTTATTFYEGSKLPTTIKDAAASNYGAYTLTSGEQITLLQKGEIYYRLRLRKGAQKLVVYVDENGNELSQQEVPEEVTAD